MVIVDSKFSAGMPLNKLIPGTSRHVNRPLFNLIASCNEVKFKSALRGVPHSSLHRQLPDRFASAVRDSCERSFGKSCAVYS